MVADNRPLKITTAIGLCISLPGSPPFKAKGIRAKPVVNAVIKIGFNLSNAPVLISSKPWIPSFLKSSYLETNKIPLRVAIPKRLIKPMVAAMLMIPEVKYTIKIPPISAKGRLIKTTKANFTSLNS